MGQVPLRIPYVFCLIFLEEGGISSSFFLQAKHIAGPTMPFVFIPCGWSSMGNEPHSCLSSLASLGLPDPSPPDSTRYRISAVLEDPLDCEWEEVFLFSPDWYVFFFLSPYGPLSDSFP